MGSRNDSTGNGAPAAHSDAAIQTTTGSAHISVMPDEVVRWLAEIAPRVVVDGTFGAGGHAFRLLRALPDSSVKLIALDRDPTVSERLDATANDERLSLFLGSYEQAPRALQESGLAKADAVLLDLGLSSDQLNDWDRGFSFQSDGPLDLRFDPDSGVPAHVWLQRHSEKEIADAIYQFGEERFSRRIARQIVDRARKRQPITTVADLVEICSRSVPRSRNHDIHPATRTFQALRIVVNDELGILQRTLGSAPDWIGPGGRMAVISFHSLEDRIVKRAFKDDDRWTELTRKPLRPTAEEVRRNPRSRSAKLRVAARRDDS